MSTAFPVGLDSFSLVPQAQNVVLQHRERTQNAEDAIEALEVKVGVNTSADTDSLDYRVRALENATPSVTSTFTFTPAVTFATPGDVSVIYGNPVGYGYQLGNLRFVVIALSFTPTYTTASGEFRITGLPTAAATGTDRNAALTIGNISTNFTWPASSTQLAGQVPSGADYVRLLGLGNGVNATALTTVHVPSGTGKQIMLSGCYVVS